MAVQFSDGLIQLRGKYEVYQYFNVPKESRLISCQADIIYYLNKNNVEKIEVRHLEHSRPSFSGFTPFMLVIFIVFILFLYNLDQRKPLKQERKK